MVNRRGLTRVVDRVRPRGVVQSDLGISAVHRRRAEISDLRPADTRRLRRPPALRTVLVGTTALTAATVCGCLFLSDRALALPTDGTVIEGQADIVYGANSVTIQQGSDRVVIEWQTFDIGAHESVSFVQPSEFAAALNRVLSGGPSQILGSLTANGQVFISNPAGVVFGPDAHVDVAAIVATSLDIMNRDFMNSRLDFTIAGDPTAVVENHGTIRASGLAALVGPGARNAGTIVADVAILGGGQGFALDYYGDGLVNFAITAPATDRPIDAEGNALAALVVNDGTILSDGGQVILTADAAAGVIDNVINLSGVVQARSVEASNGQVVLLGGDEGTVTVAGTIDATGDDAGEQGGTVHLLGETVRLADGAVVDVSGQAGGGTALIGGAAGGGALPAGALAYLAPAAGGRSGTTVVADAAFETGGFIPTADIVYVDAAAAVAADATDAGNGGTVVAWANEEMQFHGAFSAQGGTSGGDGGIIEVSTAGGGIVDGTGMAGAVAGAGGQFLIDPQNVCVAAAGNCGFSAGFLLVTPTTIQTFFATTAGGTFTVRTDQANIGGHQGDIVVASSLNIAATGTGSLLRFLAHDDISQNGGVNIINTGAALNIEMIAEAFGPTPNDQDIFIDGDITTNGGTFFASAERFITDNDDDTITTAGGTVTILANELTFAQSDTLNPGEIVINAGSGKVQFDRVDAGEFSLGDNNGGTHLSQAELGAIRAGTLVVGEGGSDQIANHDVQVNLINVDNVSTNGGIITGQVRLYALEGNNGDVEFSGANTFVSLAAFADDDILLLNNGSISITGGVGAIVALSAGDNVELRAASVVTTNGGAVSLGAGTNNATDTVLLDGDVTTNGGRFAALGRTFIIDDDGDTLSTSGGKVEIQADIIDIDETNAGVPAIDAGNGSVYIYRTTPGTVGLGQAGGGLQLTQGEIDQINAFDLTIGDPDNGIAGDDLSGHSNNITDIALFDVDFTDNGANDQGISTLVRLFSLRQPEEADITFTGNVVVPQLHAAAIDQILVTASGNANPTLLSELGTINLIASAVGNQPGLTINGLITAATNFNAATQQVSIDANIIAPGGITGSAQLVTVVGSTNGAQINDALGMITTGATPGSPARINVGNGTYNEAVVVTKNNVVLQAGPGAIVNPNSPGFTINANGVVIDGFTYSGTAGSPAILLTGVADNVSILNGTITGTTGSGAGIQIDNTVTAALDLTVDNVSMTGVAGTGIQFDPTLNGADITITGSTIAGAVDGIRFGTIANSSVFIGGLLAAAANSIHGGNVGIFTGNISGGSVMVGGNSLVRGDTFSGIVIGALSNNALVAILNNTEIRGGNLDGIDILQVTDSTVAIAGNGSILGDGDDGIFVSNAIINSTVTIGSATVTIGGVPTLFAGNGQIIGANDGLDIDAINSSRFRVSDNTLVRGTAGEGMEFDNVIADGASVEIIGNDEIHGATHGINFEHAIADSSVTIAGNTTMLGDANDGIRFSGALTGDTVLIGGLAALDANSIRGALNGIFTGNIAGGSFVVVGNTLVRGTTQDGILTGVLSAGATFGVAGNAEVRGGLDAVGVGGVIGGSTVVIADNDLITGDNGDGVFVSTAIADSVFRAGGATLTVGGTPTLFGGNGSIIGHENAFDIDQIASSTVEITSNTLVQGSTQEAIQFDNTVNAGSTIQVLSNGTIHGATDGIAFLAAVDDSTVTIAGNVIAGDTENGIRFGATLTGDTVLIGGLGVGDANNIAGGTVGIAAGNISGGGFVVAGNTLIQGTLFSGIQVGALSNGLLFGIVGNTEIRGVGLDAIDILQVNDSTVAIAGNAGIFGDGDDGIFISTGVFNSTFTVGTATVDVGGTPTAFGGNDQIVAKNDGMDIDLINDSIFTVADNVQIRGMSGEGLEFDNTVVNGSAVAVVGNGVIRGGTSAIDFQALIDGSSVTIAGSGVLFGDTVDGIRFADLTAAEILVGIATVTVDGTPVDFAGNRSIAGAVNGIAFTQTIGSTNTVTIDGNGAATQGGVDYDGTDEVELVNLLTTGAITGTTGSGIVFAPIGGDAAVTVARNFVAISATGITFNAINSTRTTAVHNNFVQANFGNGLLFAGDVATRTEVFQNFIERNLADGIRVAAAANLGVDHLFVQVNFLPGNGFLFGNSGFGFNHLGLGSPDLEGNWWGTASAGFTASINGVAAADLPTLIVLATGDDDANITPPFANTAFEFFAFQPETIGAVPEPIIPVVLPVDVDALSFDRRGSEHQLDRPGGAAFHTNELGAGYQANIFGDSYGIGTVGNPGGLQPAAGGQTAQCQEGDEDCQQDQGQQGPINLGGLTPAAGPGSPQALAEDTCVAAFLGDFWSAGVACQ